MKNLFVFLLLLPSLSFGYQSKDYHRRFAKGLKRTSHSQIFVLLAEHTSYLTDPTPIPKSFDLRGKVSPPEDQGQCGSCWDFSLTKALRSAFMVLGKDPGTLSFNYLLNNCGPGPYQGGCNGGDFNAVENFKSPNGPWLESQDPYQGYETSCRDLPAKASMVSYTFLGGNNGPSFKDLAYGVGVSHQLLSIDVAVSSKWMAYGSGIYNACNSQSIDHMVDLAGYDCESSKDADGNCVFNEAGEPINKDGYLLVQNNWGNWGEDGYMRTRHLGKNGQKCNAVASTALMFKVQ